MKATIYKNDEFKTVGLEVVNADVTLFAWGCTAKNFYYSKTVDADRYTAEVLELIRGEQMRRYYDHHFVKDVLDTNMDERNMAKRKDAKDTATFITIDKERLADLDAHIKQLIDKIH